ncbi:hypothetical protein GCM10007304_06550 [Rhodococcoides trifolii]|uniref:DUF4873 domain-containing protein n=1 Tax=Rhodococcoides trifolii TaxID=908250 RepID=A0A917FP57_9NOCA|nr:DUF4873 domain-containing protein [Rhodococcus trifolii]GGF95380.1 hypothetical protein GCM10007304_06550 [Rhodococcus trifolii]
MTDADYAGPATLVVDDTEFAVELELRGHAQPIDGIYRWYGRIRPDDALHRALGGRRKPALVRTPGGEAPGTVGDVDFWGRYRIQGKSTPPYRIETDVRKVDMAAAREASPSADDALSRAAGMIDTARVARVSTSGGFVDVLPDTADAPTPTVAQHAMNNPVVAAIYEKLWRPALGRVAMGVGSMSVDDERRRAVSDMRLKGEMTVLDVACGPGNFTRFLSEHLGGDGIAIGFDISAPMIARAVRDNRGPRAAYVRGDARTLPYADGSFDAVCCYAALYLVPEPFTVVDELMRVVKPGGRIALMTSYGRSFAPVKAAVTAGAALSGIRMFDKSTFTDILRAAGFAEIGQDIRGVAQFVSATRG